jgi:hypothetical protein
MPHARRENGLRAIERAGEALRLQTLAGKDPRTDAVVNRERGATIAEERRRNRQWKREHPEGGGHDRAWFLREVMPKLDDVPLSAIARDRSLARRMFSLPSGRAGAASPSLERIAGAG